MKSKEKGITLIALVVTIIILLILAGVAINLSIGDNGLFHKAQEAVNTYKDSESKESQELSMLENELEKAKIDWSKVYDSTGYAPDNTPIETNEGTYYIPQGFKLADDSAGKISDGIVVEDKNGNQWVWVPCYVEGGVDSDEERRVKFNRYDFGFQQGSFSNYSETMPEDQSSSVATYGGFYIGRYEAGDKESTEAKEMRSEEKYLNSYSGDSTHKVTIKKNQAPYNMVKPSEQIILSSEFAQVNDYTDKMFTVQISSYAWDTTLKFIGGTYAVSSPQGNYTDTSFSYRDLNGNIQHKSIEATLVPTGQTTPVKNIYDMGGNLSENTTEKFNPGDIACRGGHCGFASNVLVAGWRGKTNDSAYTQNGFRIALFLK